MNVPLRLPATIAQLATYIERDGATLTFPAGVATVRVPLGPGYVTYLVPESMEAELDAERDKIHQRLAAQRRRAQEHGTGRSPGQSIGR